MKQLITLMIILLLSGCATSKQFMPRIESSIVEPDMYRVCVLRPKAIGGTLGVAIKEDDEIVGILYPKSFLEWDTEEESIELAARLYYSGLNLDQEFENEFDIDLAEGETTYVVVHAADVPKVEKVTKEKGEYYKLRCEGAEIK